MRGQISLEYLLISVIALAMLSISAAALLEIKDYSEKSTGLFRFRSSADALADAIDEVCALGNGNSRVLTLRSEVSVDWEEGGIVLSGQTEIVRRCACEVVPEDSLQGIVIVRNNKGVVRIREQ